MGWVELCFPSWEIADAFQLALSKFYDAWQYYEDHPEDEAGLSLFVKAAFELAITSERTK